MRQSNLHSLGFAVDHAPVTKGAGLSADVTSGTGIDLQGYESATFVFHLGTIAHADTDGDFVIQESDTTTDGDYSAVASTDLIGDDVITNLAVADSGVTRKKGYIGTKRYVRAKLTLTTGASTGSFPYAVTVVRGNARTNPVA